MELLADDGVFSVNLMSAAANDTVTLLQELQDCGAGPVLPQFKDEI